jgi:hypothetical protein
MTALIPPTAVYRQVRTVSRQIAATYGSTLDDPPAVLPRPSALAKSPHAKTITSDGTNMRVPEASVRMKRNSAET